MTFGEKIFFVILIVAHAFFFLKALDNGHVFTKDSFEYIQQAKNIRDYHSWYCGDFRLPVQPALFSQRPPGYGVFIFLVKKLNDSIWFLLLLQNLLSLLNFYVLVKILKLVNAQFNVLYLLIPLIFFPSQFIYPNMIMSEMLLQSAVTLSFYFITSFILLNKTASLYFYQLFISIALLIKPVWYLFPGVSILFFVFLIKRKNILGWSILTHAIPIIVIALIFLSNHYQTNYWEYSSIQRKLMINYNAYEVLENCYGKKNAVGIIDSIQTVTALQSSYPAQANYLQSESNKILIRHPFVFAWIELKGIVRYFTDHSRYDFESFFSHIPDENNSLKEEVSSNGFRGFFDQLHKYGLGYFSYLALSVIVNLILFVSLFIFMRQKNIEAAVRFFLFFMIIYVALLTGPTGTTRFRLPVYPLQLIAFSIVIPSKMRNHFQK